MSYTEVMYNGNRTAEAFDGTVVPVYGEKLPCGGVPVWDYESGFSYRCDICGAVIGSIGMPKRCKSMVDETL